jgi:hypothetical protein
VTTESTRLPDWKTTPAYRVLVAGSWGVIGLAVFLGAAGAMFDAAGVWWMVAGLALLVILITLLLPEPVPHDMLIESRKYLGPQ